MERAGHVYSRISNPTNAVLEERIAALENGVGAIAGPRARPPCTSPSPPDGRRRPHRGEPLPLRRLPQPARIHPAPLRHHHHFRRSRDLDAWRRHPFGNPAAFRRNPGQSGAGRPRHSSRLPAPAHDHGLPPLVDSTFTTPYLLRPSTSGPTSSFIPPPSSWAGTAWSSEAWWSIRAASTGRRGTNSPPSANPMPASMA